MDPSIDERMKAIKPRGAVFLGGRESVVVSKGVGGIFDATRSLEGLVDYWMSRWLNICNAREKDHHDEVKIYQLPFIRWVDYSKGRRHSRCCLKAKRRR